ncbi:MAG TPA: DUF481 domain-containing protein [Desulfobacterales bacterium]|nr:MAG: hypothetical protein DRI57_29450 [Deltaproteobacteria bacterium]HHC24108.1 DUF481 domain-containing protein [Desulfobacterales bacterium]
MTKISRGISFMWIAFLLVLFSFTGANAQESQVPPKWWRVSPLSYPETSELLYHVKLNYSYAKSSGATSKDNHTAKCTFVLRKHRFTNSLIGKLKIRDEKSASDRIVYTDEQGAIPSDDQSGRTPTSYYVEESDVTSKKYKEKKLIDELRIALIGGFYVGPGVIWEMSEKKQIDSKFIYYGGCGYDFSPHKDLAFKLYAAYAKEELEYSDVYEAYVRSFKTPTDYETGTISSDKYYLVQQASWNITAPLTLNQNITYIGDIDRGSRYEWEFNLGLAYQITKYISLNTAYKEELDNLPQYSTSRKRETELTVGFTVNY